jgi:integration host factor subunit alpha
MNITKKDLSSSLKDEFSLSGEQGSIIVDEFFTSLAHAIKINPTVKISSFGTFKKIITKSRVGRNPQTMDIFPILSKEKIKFLPSSKTKNMLN